MIQIKDTFYFQKDQLLSLAQSMCLCPYVAGLRRRKRKMNEAGRERGMRQDCIFLVSELK